MSGKYPSLSRSVSKRLHAVWRCASRIADAKTDQWHGFITVGEIEAEMELSRKTAKKYLDLLCDYEKMIHVTYQKSVSIYQIQQYAEGYK